jgi:hypothetical protein
VVPLSQTQSPCAIHSAGFNAAIVKMLFNYALRITKCLVKVLAMGKTMRETRGTRVHNDLVFSAGFSTIIQSKGNRKH